MLTEAELTQATMPPICEKLSSDELVCLGIALGHYVVPETTEYACDSHEGYLRCECGWESRIVKACWWREMVQDHLEEVVARLYDANGEERP